MLAAKPGDLNFIHGISQVEGDNSKKPSSGLHTRAVHVHMHSQSKYQIAGSRLGSACMSSQNVGSLSRRQFEASLGYTADAI